jgi:hypothetical protein
MAMLAAAWSSPALADDNACAALRAAPELAAGGPVFIASFPTAEPGPLQHTAFLYDNAVAVIALVGCGAPEPARHIGDAMLRALANDRHWHDGRLRNGYLSGPAIDTPVQLPGWWDAKANQWVEDGYQVGSDTGNMAWAILALVTMYEASGDVRYRDGAAAIGRFADRSFRESGVPGFEGGPFGFEPEPTQNTWRSTEHNTDLTAALTRLAAATGDTHWRDRASVAAAFVQAMWNDGCQCFAVGTGVDGVTPNTLLALDAQIWPILAVPGLDAQYPSMLMSITKRLGQNGGVAYSEALAGLWIEGSAQTGLLMRLKGFETKAAELRTVIDQHRTPDGWYYAADTAELPTGFVLETDPSKPRVYFRLPHLGALAWVALFETGFNPFTGTAGLP